jgi:hypothetical protein
MSLVTLSCFGFLQSFVQSRTILAAENDKDRSICVYLCAAYRSEL